MSGWRDRINEQLAGGLTDGIEMVVVVPEHLGDRIGGQETRVMRDGAGSIEMEELQALLASDCQQFARRRHLQIIWTRYQGRGHIRVRVGCVQVPA